MTDSRNLCLPCSGCRSIFCCIAPTSHEQYHRQDEGPVVIRPPPLPPLPVWEEPVIGDVVPEDTGGPRWARGRECGWQRCWLRRW